jgi:hypothetical protein
VGGVDQLDGAGHRIDQLGRQLGRHSPRLLDDDPVPLVHCQGSKKAASSRSTVRTGTDRSSSGEFGARGLIVAVFRLGRA